MARGPQRWISCSAFGLALLSSAIPAQGTADGISQPAALTIGETFTIASKILGEVRRINVYLPPPYSQSAETRLPVLYMPDGGIGEDFLHIAGLVQVSVGNQTMRPFILVGIENTQRRRDLTGPTPSAEDEKIAPQVGGSAAFRRFIRSELMPAVNTRYRTTTEAAIIGESLAGLFVVETFFIEPDLFDTYIAFDPSLWWNDKALLKSAAERRRERGSRGKALYLGSSSETELAVLTQQLADRLRKTAPAHLTVHYEPMPTETHATIYHPAALVALRRLFKPVSPDPAEPPRFRYVLHEGFSGWACVDYGVEGAPQLKRDADGVYLIEPVSDGIVATASFPNLTRAPFGSEVVRVVNGRPRSIKVEAIQQRGEYDTKRPTSRYCLFFGSAAAARLASRPPTMAESRLGTTPLLQQFEFSKGSLCDFRDVRDLCLSASDVSGHRSDKTIVGSLASHRITRTGDCDNFDGIVVQYSADRAVRTHGAGRGPRYGFAELRREQRQHGTVALATWSDPGGGAAGTVAKRFARDVLDFFRHVSLATCTR